MDSSPTITISEYELETVHEFTYLGSTIADSLHLESELNKRIGKAATTMNRLKKRAWSNNKLTEHTKVQIYKACVLSTLLYGSETWTMHAHHEKRLNVFHMRQLRFILNITWQDKTSNKAILHKANIPSMFTLLKQRRLRWLGHVIRMVDGRIPKDLLYGELAEGTRPSGRPHLRYKDICKRDLVALDIGLDTWETTARDRDEWRHAITESLLGFETKLHAHSELKRAQKKARMDQNQGLTSQFICGKCGRDCKSRIGHYSHSRRCKGNGDRDVPHHEP